MERLDSKRKVARKGVLTRSQARLFSSANPTQDSQLSRFLVTFFLSQGAEGGRKPFVPQGIVWSITQYTWYTAITFALTCALNKKYATLPVLTSTNVLNEAWSLPYRHFYAFSGRIKIYRNEFLYSSTLSADTSQIVPPCCSISYFVVLCGVKRPRSGLASWQLS